MTIRKLHGTGILQPGGLGHQHLVAPTQVGQKDVQDRFRTSDGRYDARLGVHLHSVVPG